jgi:hypothetical protein
MDHRDRRRRCRAEWASTFTDSLTTPDHTPIRTMRRRRRRRRFVLRPVIGGAPAGEKTGDRRAVPQKAPREIVAPILPISGVIPSAAPPSRRQAPLPAARADPWILSSASSTYIEGARVAALDA